MASEHLIKITNKAKQLRRANPKLKWTDAVKKASKLIKPAAKKSAPKKRAVAKKVAGKKTIVTKKNVSQSKIDAAFKNPAGMVYSNDPAVRKAVADKAKNILKNLQSKKIGAKKTATKTHKDTKSHNVNIRVVSGVGGVSEKIKQLSEYQKLLQREQKAIQSIAYWKGQIKNPSTAANGMHAKAFLELNKKQLAAIKQQITIQKKLI